jgi:hypothetical protein
VIELVAAGRDSATVHWRAVGEVEEARTLGVSGGLASLVLPPLVAALEYWATSPDGASTRTHVLTPSDPSLLVDLLLEVIYPPHTRLPPAEIRGSPDALAVPEGTRIDISGGIQGEGANVLLRDASGEERARLPITDRRFSGVLSATRSAVLEWVVEGGQGGGLPPPALDLEVIPDAAPRLTFPEPGTAGELPLALRLPLMLEAVDDYGIAWVEVETRLREPTGQESGGSVDRIPSGDRPTVTLHPTLDFSQWGVRPGDEILVRARAADNAPTPHIVESETYVLRMPAVSELRDMARARIGEVASRTEVLLDQAAREEQDLRDLERRSRLAENRPGGADAGQEAFEDREEVRQALERQAALAQELEELQERLAEAGRSLGDEEADLELAGRIAELERLLEEVLGEEARERLEELLDSFLQGEPPEELASTAGDMAARQQQMRERLEQMLDRLRRSVLEEALRSAEEELRSVADAQEALADSLRMGQGVDSQQEVARRTEAIEERIGELGSELRAQDEPQAADQADEAGRQTSEARQAMEEGVEEATQGDAEAASERAEEAAQSLESALDTLEESRSMLEEEWQDAMREGLRRGAQDALALARRQEELARQFPSAGPARRSELEGEEAAIRDGLRNLARDLADATTQVPDVGRRLSEGVGRALAAAEETLETLRGTQGVRPQTGQAAEAAQRAMNEIALLALEGLEQQGESGQAGATMNQIRAELESLAAAQESVNRGSSSLGQDPGADGASERLEQLANAQETIAGRLGEMAQRPGAGQGSGNLDALSEEAREIAEELGGGRLDGTMLERQSRFLELLLSAGRTLERDEPTDEREARAARPVERSFVSPIPGYLLEEQAVPLPTLEELEALSPAQRRLVLDYFERLNVRRARGEEGP